MRKDDPRRRPPTNLPVVQAHRERTDALRQLKRERRMAKRRKAPLTPAQVAAKAQRRALKKEKKARQRAALGAAGLNAIGSALGGTDFGKGLGDFTGIDLSTIGDAAAGAYLANQGFGPSMGVGAPAAPPAFADAPEVYGPPQPREGWMDFLDSIPTWGKVAGGIGVVLLARKMF
jgi:hypothetical protein